MLKLIGHNKKRSVRRILDRRLVWVCSCRYEIVKKTAELSGYAAGSQGHHVHCPKCGKVVAQFLKPKE